MIKAIIFDMDGVLVDTEKSRFDVIRESLRKRGLELHDEDYPKFIGRKTRVILDDLFGDKLTEEQKQEIGKERYDAIYADPDQYVIPYPYAQEICSELAKSYVLGVASAARAQEVNFILEKLGIRKHFSAIVGSDNIKNLKPAPDTYLECVRTLGLESEECVAIEDAPLGVTSAKSAGCTCIAVTHTHQKSELQEADEIIDSLEKLREILVK